MDPISLIVSALVTGAAAGLKPTAEAAVKDSYQALKAFIQRKWKASAAIEAAERDPAAPAAKATLKQELQQTNAASDPELLALVKQVLETVGKYAPDTGKEVGADADTLVLLDHIKAGGSLNINEVLGGVKVTNADINKDINISGIRRDGVAGLKTPDASQRPVFSTKAVEVNIEKTQVGGNIQVPVNVTLSLNDPRQYLVTRGIEPYQQFRDGPQGPWELDTHGVEDVSDLRIKLLRLKELEKPVQLTVSGTLFPCALLSNGWWERALKHIPNGMRWQTPLQEWLFNGFDLWAPSWDYSWNLDQEAWTDTRDFCLAQLGGGDEADSLPILIPREKALKLRSYFLENPGGMEAEVTGLLGHRSQFGGKLQNTELFGGLLDFCLWLDDDNARHKISLPARDTSLYSGYLWKCLVPKGWIGKRRDQLALNQVYFVWEHTNFASPDAIKFNLDSLEHKQRYLEGVHGELELIQKSSALVPGKPAWTPEQVYMMLSGKRTTDI